MSESTILYDVRMRTSIGTRFGQMSVARNEDRVSGFLDILRHKEPFEGTIDRDGSCTLQGTLVTLMRTVHFQAVGKILPEKLELSMKDGHHLLEITGEPVIPPKENVR